MVTEAMSLEVTCKAKSFEELFEEQFDLSCTRGRQMQAKLESSPHGPIEQFGVIRCGHNHDMGGQLLHLE